MFLNVYSSKKSEKYTFLLLEILILKILHISAEIKFLSMIDIFFKSSRKARTKSALA
jgi:hypothetical protein